MDDEWTFPFMHLPAEIRCKIYSDLFSPGNRGKSEADRPALETSILLVNKQIYNESRSLEKIEHP